MTNVKSIIKHFLGWVAFFIVTNFEFIILGIGHPIRIFLGFTGYIIAMPFFYFTVGYLNPKFFIKKRYIFLLIWLIILFFVYNFIRVYQLKFWDIIIPEDKMIHTDNDQSVSFYSIFLPSSSYYIAFMTYFIAFCLWQNIRVQNEQLNVKNEQLYKQQTEIEKLGENKVKMEYQLLSSQINPHFLYNTLNTFYAMAALEPQDSSLADGIMALSNIMSYSLTASVKGGWVPLTREVQHIRDVISIYRLRFPDNMFLNFNVEDDKIQDISIPPLTLLTLAENVFKHGNIGLKEFPATMNLTVSGSVLRFETWNKKKKGIKEGGTGIGIDNINLRLKYAYGEDCKIRIKDMDDEYYAVVEIDTSKKIKNSLYDKVFNSR